MEVNGQEEVLLRSLTFFCCCLDLSLLHSPLVISDNYSNPKVDRIQLS